MFWGPFLLLTTLFYAGAGDQGFRFTDDYCNKNGRPGYNPSYYGECGNLTRERLIGQQESDLDLLGANLNAIYIENSKFQGGNWNSVLFRRALVFQSRWQGLQAEKMDLSASQLKGADFTDCNFKDSYFQGARLEKVSFVSCDLSQSLFWGASLVNVNFENSDLSGANLLRTFMLFVNFKGAKFNQDTQLPFSQEEALKKGMVKLD